MKIESLSIKTTSIAIYSGMGVIAVVLSLLAASYFKQAALDAQISSLSRVIEVATQEVFNQVRARTFDLGMKLSYSHELVSMVRSSAESPDTQKLVNLLDDPFVNGFVGFSELDLDKIRVFNLKLELIGESTQGSENIGAGLNGSMAAMISRRQASDRLKAIDALWMSPEGPLFSTLVPLGGLRPVGYLEVIVNPVFNLPEVGRITKTPVRIYSMSGEPVNSNRQEITQGHLPVEFTALASDGTPAFKIAGYENIDALNAEMEKTQTLTTSVFLILSFGTLFFALWLFNSFLFSPLRRMIRDMQQIAHGKLELTVNNRGLREFHLLADAFNSMTEKVRMRTNDLQRLLDLDDSALMCFDQDREAVYFNKGATALFGHASDEIIDLDIDDLFSDDIALLLNNAEHSQKGNQDHLRKTLNCKHRDGHFFQAEASINAVDVMGRSGLAIVINAHPGSKQGNPVESDQRLNAVEQTLNMLLAFARENPGVKSGLGHLGLMAPGNSAAEMQKSKLREQVVQIMNLALACWEHKLGKTKIELAEESRIWPVYIDKSTPTTRTLDKYLNIESCPKNPRCQRAVNTAEFVMRNIKSKLPGDRCEDLQAALESLRQLLAGIKPVLG